jgi:malonyl CoA-acyl carrier protein transacylase
VRTLLGTEFTHPTLWNETYEAMVADGWRSFVEVGPGDMLSKTARWIDRSTVCRPAGSLAAIRAVSDSLAGA